VTERDPRAFAIRLAELLGHPERYADFARAAREAARRYEVAETVKLWDDVLRAGHDGEMPA